MIEMSKVDESKWLLTINYLRNIPTKKSIFDIQLMNGPRLRNYDAQNSADGSRLDNRTQGLIKISTRMLRITTDNPMSLVASQ